MEPKYKQCEICGRSVVIYPNQTYNTCPTCGTAVSYEDIVLDYSNSINYQYGQEDDRMHFMTPVYRVEKQVRPIKKEITVGEFIGLLLLSIFVIPVGTIITGIVAIKHFFIYPEYKRYKFLIMWCWAWLFLSAEIWIPIGIWLFKTIQNLI